MQDAIPAIAIQDIAKQGGISMDDNPPAAQSTQFPASRPGLLSWIVAGAGVLALIVFLVVY